MNYFKNKSILSLIIFILLLCLFIYFYNYYKHYHANIKFLNKNSALSLLLDNSIENIYDKDNIVQYNLKFNNSKLTIKDILRDNVLEFYDSDKEIISLIVCLTTWINKRSRSYNSTLLKGS